MAPFKRLPVLVGCMSRKLDSATLYEWKVYFKSFYGEDIAPLIRSVGFTLHPSFHNPRRSVTNPPYMIQEIGYGEFDMKITVYFKDRSQKNFSILQAVKLTGAPQLSAEEELDDDKWLHDKHLITINFCSPSPWLRTVLHHYSEIDDEVFKKMQANMKAQQEIKNEIKKLQMEGKRKEKEKQLKMEKKVKQKGKIKKQPKEELKEEKKQTQNEKINVMKEQVEKKESPKPEEEISDGLDGLLEIFN